MNKCEEEVRTGGSTPVGVVCCLQTKKHPRWVFKKMPKATLPSKTIEYRFVRGKNGRFDSGRSDLLFTY